MNKNHMSISTDTHKKADKTQHPFMIKNSQQSGYRGNIPHIIKAIYDKPTANITLKQGKAESISSKIRYKTRRPTPLAFILHSTESPSYNNQTRKRN